MTDHTPARRRRWPRLAVFAGALLLAVALCIIVHLMGVSSRLDAIRAAGLPVTPAELDAWYTIPPDVDNAADLYARAATLYVEDLDVPGVGCPDLPEPDQRIPDAMRKQIAAHLAKNRAALKLLHQAATVEHCRHPVRLGDGFDAWLPHLGDLREGARLLKLEAIISALDGRSSDATQALLAAAAAARSLRREPVAVSQTVRFCIESITITALQQVLTRRKLPPSDLERLEAALRNAEAPDALHRAFVGGRCLGLDFLNTRKDFW